MFRRHVGQRVWSPEQLAPWERNGLVGHWVSDGTSGTLRDRSGHDYDLATSGTAPRVATGVTDDRMCGWYDGSSMGHRRTSLATAQKPSTLTFCAWVRPETLTGAFRPILNSYDSGTLFFGMSNAGVLYIEGLTGAAPFPAAGYAFVANMWQFVAVSGTSASWSTFLSVGDYSGGRWHGRIDDARLYDRVLSTAELRELALPSRRIAAMGRRGRYAAAAPATGNPWYYFANQQAVTG